MTRLDHSQVLIALLGLGMANLAALNHWALPGTFTVTETEINSATDGSHPVSILRPAPLPESTPLSAARVARVAPASPTPSAAAAAPAALVANVDTSRLDADADADAAADANAVVLFQRGTWWISRRGRAALRDSLAQLPAGQVVIEIEGHADAAGPRGLNQRISEERAQAVAALLEHAGISDAQIQVRAFGERRPRTIGNNRRVEIRIRGAP